MLIGINEADVLELTIHNLPSYVFDKLGKGLKLYRVKRNLYVATWVEHDIPVQIAMRSHSSDGARAELRRYVVMNYNVTDRRAVQGSY